MVQIIVKPIPDSSAPLGWKMEEIETSTILEMPSIIYDELKGKYMSADEMLEIIDTMQVVLAGCTTSLTLITEHEYSYDRRSVLKTFKLKSLGTIDDEIDWFLESVAEYEKYHTIYMDRDVQGDDTTIHAYIETPKDSLLRSRFDKDIRIEAKRNNIKYWISNYQIDCGSKGGKFVTPITTPVEIM